MPFRTPTSRNCSSLRASRPLHCVVSSPTAAWSQRCALPARKAITSSPSPTAARAPLLRARKPRRRAHLECSHSRWLRRISRRSCRSTRFGLSTTRKWRPRGATPSPSPPSSTRLRSSPRASHSTLVKKTSNRSIRCPRMTRSPTRNQTSSPRPSCSSSTAALAPAWALTRPSRCLSLKMDCPSSTSLPSRWTACASRPENRSRSCL
mmetsp:Transcript_82896/g.165473  ORF Transcript_82896/g.165473 Transcript_82896/m.165473 type:complete len:207 (+) Transcript_82896:480-1100(+)